MPRQEFEKHPIPQTLTDTEAFRIAVYTYAELNLIFTWVSVAGFRNFLFLAPHFYPVQLQSLVQKAYCVTPECCPWWLTNWIVVDARLRTVRANAGDYRRLYHCWLRPSLRWYYQEDKTTTTEISVPPNGLKVSAMPTDIQSYISARPLGLEMWNGTTWELFNECPLDPGAREVHLRAVQVAQGVKRVLTQVVRELSAGRVSTSLRDVCNPEALLVVAIVKVLNLVLEQRLRHRLASISPVVPVSFQSALPNPATSTTGPVNSAAIKLCPTRHSTSHSKSSQTLQHRLSGLPPLYRLMPPPPPPPVVTIRWRDLEEHYHEERMTMPSGVLEFKSLPPQILKYAHSQTPRLAMEIMLARPGIPIGRWYPFAVGREVDDGDNVYLRFVRFSSTFSIVLDECMRSMRQDPAELSPAWPNDLYAQLGEWMRIRLERIVEKRIEHRLNRKKPKLDFSEREWELETFQALNPPGRPRFQSPPDLDVAKVAIPPASALPTRLIRYSHATVKRASARLAGTKSAPIKKRVVGKRKYTRQK
ncbi:hypothetical protein BKA62DRAFT_672569 [Auriculariales sp. MPI-PUGE-AT-0066]|nr:hypothetical protein BKA62DRAFT_672569 [Auriculariales sp. MPI-PUGE-AT-0066]